MINNNTCGVTILGLGLYFCLCEGARSRVSVMTSVSVESGLCLDGSSLVLHIWVESWGNFAKQTASAYPDLITYVLGRIQK